MRDTPQQKDWRVQPFEHPASVEETDGLLILSNGLIQRTFVTSPNFATVDYQYLGKVRNFSDFGA